MKLNVKLLQRIKKHLRAEPKRYDQGTYGDEVFGRGAPVCGTKGCIAGWAVFLSMTQSRWKFWIKRDRLSVDWPPPIALRARKLLGLSSLEAKRLFSVDNQKYWTGKLGVREACAKIDKLIAERRAADKEKA